MAKASAFRWSHEQEMNFIKKLSPPLLLGYTQAFKLRRRWGNIKEEKIKQFLFSESKIRRFILTKGKLVINF